MIPLHTLGDVKRNLGTDQVIHIIDLFLHSKLYQNLLINKGNMNDFVFEIGLPTVVIEYRPSSELIRTAGLQV